MWVIEMNQAQNIRTIDEISSLSGRPRQCISAQISPQLIKIRIKSFQMSIRVFDAGFQRNPNNSIRNSNWMA